MERLEFRSFLISTFYSKYVLDFIKLTQQSLLGRVCLGNYRATLSLERSI